MIVTPNNIKECHQEVMSSVYDNDYYVSLLPEGKPETTQEIISYWNRFWMNLPDSKSIRRNPFYEICDIAECRYDEQFYEEIV